MSSGDRSLWPNRARQPWLRLAASVISAPVLLAAMLTGLVFAVATVTMAPEDEAMAVTTDAARRFFILLPVFTLTFGLIGVVFLAAFGLRTVLSWVLIGGAIGALAPAIRAAANGAVLLPMQSVVAAALSVTLFLLIRWLAGVRVS